MCFEELLIDLVREREFLYNTRSKTYKNVLKRNSAWEEIGKILNRPVGECKQRWKSLRDRFVREKRSMDQPSGSGAGVADTWEFFDVLKFLIPSLTPRRQTGNYQETAAESFEDLPSPISGEDFNFVIDDGNDMITPKRARSSKRMAEEEFKSFLGGLNATVSTHLSTAPPAHDVDEEFMLNMAKRMKPLPESIRIRLHAKILAAVNEEVLKLLE